MSTPSRSVETKRNSVLVVEQALEVLAIRRGSHARGNPLQIAGRDVSEVVGDLLDARDLEPLALLDRLDVVRGLEERLVGAGIEPRDAAAEALDVQVTHL